jgi:hypothetical protein
MTSAQLAGEDWRSDEKTMFPGELSRCSIGSLVFAAAIAVSLAGAQAHDQSKYPDWNGQWRRPPGVNNQWDPTKPRGQEGAPLTPEFQAIFEANLKEQDEGGQGTDPTDTCIPDGKIGRRWTAHAGQERPAPARPEIF